MLSTSPCHCGSQTPFTNCCHPLLRGKQVAETAEQLMRSRYSAFCVGNVDYLITTHHPSKRTPNDQRSLRRTCQGTEWMGLTVVKTEQGTENDEDGYVEFVAVYRDRSLTGLQPVGKLHERSRFVKEEGRWYYVDGVMAPATPPKRNDPCWCGSGKKFKKCHG